MRLIIDNREQALIAAATVELASTSIGLLVEALSIGDASIEQDDGTPLVLFERKSIADLLSSIKDGRYSEQAHRLLYSGTHASHNIIYLIEGSYTHLPTRDKKTVVSAMTSIQLFKGFSIQRTTSVVDSANMIVGMAKRIEQKLAEGMTFAFSNQSNTNTATVTGGDSNNTDTATKTIPNYSAVVKKVKKDNITCENIGEIMLCQVPGISSAIASAIMTHPEVQCSIPKLCALLETNQQTISNICISNSRKVGNAITHKLKLLLFPTTSTELPSELPSTVLLPELPSESQSELPSELPSSTKDKASKVTTKDKVPKDKVTKDKKVTTDKVTTDKVTKDKASKVITKDKKVTKANSKPKDTSPCECLV